MGNKKDIKNKITNQFSLTDQVPFFENPVTSSYIFVVKLTKRIHMNPSYLFPASLTAEFF